MKFLKMLLVSVIVLFASSAWALTFAWDHDNPSNVLAYTLYYEPTIGSPGPDWASVSDGNVMTITIPDSHFEPNVEYTIYVTASNISGESDHSDSITYTRTGWGPKPDKPPAKLHIKPGKPKNPRKQ
jgi:hypothetical protein